MPSGMIVQVTSSSMLAWKLPPTSSGERRR